MIVTGQDHLIGPWICERAGGDWNGHGVTIGFVKDGEILAGVLFDDYNGVNVNMHVAAVDSRRWMTREYLWFCFYYPFEQLKVKRITGLVDEGNQRALAFDKHLGFVEEARLKEAAPGGDLVVLRMFKEDCKWLRIKHGNSISSDTAS